MQKIIKDILMELSEEDIFINEKKNLVILVIILHRIVQIRFFIYKNSILIDTKKIINKLLLSTKKKVYFKEYNLIVSIAKKFCYAIKDIL